VPPFPRASPSLAPASPLFGALEKALGDYAEVTRQTQPWDGEVTPAAADADVSRPASRAPSVVFYQPATASLAVHKVKPGTFDLLLTVVIAAYLGLVYVYFKGVDETMKQVQGLLTSKDKKKVR
jgi:flavoprotein